MSGRLWDISHFMRLFESGNRASFSPFCFFPLSFWIVCLTFMFNLVFRNTCIIYIWKNNRELALRGTHLPGQDCGCSTLIMLQSYQNKAFYFVERKCFCLSNVNFLIVSILEKVLKFLSSLPESELNQVRRPKVTVEWKFSSPSSKFKDHPETPTIGRNALYLGSKRARSLFQWACQLNSLKTGVWPKISSFPFRPFFSSLPVLLRKFHWNDCLRDQSSELIINPGYFWLGKVLWKIASLKQGFSF